MLLSVLVWSALIVSALPLCLFVVNLFFYRHPNAVAAGTLFPVSILIPARNEERTIEMSVRAALASRNVDLEVIVLDDHSTDRTAEIVGRIASMESRVRVEPAPPLPPGWCGKQFACSVLATLSTKSTLCFIDADVRLSPDGVAPIIQAMRARGASLMSGFPWQETHTPLEQLLLPLMHFLLLGFLPMPGMRHSTHPSFGAGCGQIFVADRAAYFEAGGHASIRSSRHDGLTLPKSFRRAGYMTDMSDVTRLASCRMYTGSSEVFQGLLKNATEGIASPARIVPFSILLMVGQVLPVVLFTYFWSRGLSPKLEMLAGLAVLCSYAARIVGVFRFRQPFLAALLHPAAIVLLLSIQWLAWARLMLGMPSTWKGRSYSTT